MIKACLTPGPCYETVFRSEMSQVFDLHGRSRIKRVDDMAGKDLISEIPGKVSHCTQRELPIQNYVLCCHGPDITVSICM